MEAFFVATILEYLSSLTTTMYFYGASKGVSDKCNLTEHILMKILSNSL